MSKRNLSKNEDAPTRRSIIMGAVVGAAVAAAALIPKTAKAAGLTKRRAEAKKTGRRLTITVHNAVFNSDESPGLEPDAGANNFVVVGNIVAVDGFAATGKYLCKGVFFPNSNLPDTPSANVGTFVDQNFIIDGVGSILGAGTEGPHVLAVLGGTGRWVGATGSYTGSGGPTPITADGVINFVFHIRRG